MNQLTQIEKIYEGWDGTPNHAQVCMRYINSILHSTDPTIFEDFTKTIEPFNE